MTSLYQQLNQNTACSNSNLIQALRNSKNPQALLQSMAQQNPQVRHVLQLVQQSGGNPQSAFYNLAKQMNVDPNSILNQLR